MARTQTFSVDLDYHGPVGHVGLREGEHVESEEWIESYPDEGWGVVRVTYETDADVNARAMEGARATLADVFPSLEG